MMLKNKDSFGALIELNNKSLKAVIAPEMGMALAEFSIAGEQILDMTREDIFLKFRKGLGPLILPHFNKRDCPPELDYSGYAHVQYLVQAGINDPFQHGVGRYMPWNYTADENSVTGKISGSDTFGSYSLAEIQGFDFEAEVSYVLKDEGLEIAFNVSGEKPVQSGIHFYYAINPDSATVTIPVSGSSEPKVIALNGDWDDMFAPDKNAKDPITYRLETDAYILDTICKVQGNPEKTFDSVTVYSPIGEKFVCVEPVTSAPYSQPVKIKNTGSILLSPEKR